MSKAVIPSFLLNKELFQQALQNLHQLNNENNLKITKCDFKLSPANGENFCSSIYQVEVQYELNGKSEQTSFIVKILIPEELEMGSNEEIMLKTVLPAMENYLKEIYKENYDSNKLYAKCLLSANIEREFFILENLNSLGYFCVDRCKGLDYEHAKLIMEKLGKLHAASMLFNKNSPDIVKSLLGSIFEKGVNTDVEKDYTYGGFEYVANMIKNWPSYEGLSEKILAIIPKYNELTFEVVNSKNSKFNVINHADLWSSNFLYKYVEESGKPKDVVFVDFQLSFWGSCGFDINFLFNSSLELQVLRDKRQKLIEIYYACLKQSLEALKYPLGEIPSLEDVLFEIKRCEIIGFYIALCELPMIALAKSQSKVLHSNIYDQPYKMKEFRDVLYNIPRVKETLKYTLKYFEEINLL